MSDLSSAPTLRPLQAVGGVLPTESDADDYAITLRAGFNYAVTLTPENDAALQLSLIDKSGVEATQSADRFGLWSSNMEPYEDFGEIGVFFTFASPFGNFGPSIYKFSARSDDTVYAQVSGRSVGLALLGTPPLPLLYTVTLGAEDDFGDTPATAGSLKVGGSVSGRFDVPSDVDTFAITLEAGQTYRFDTTSSTEFGMVLRGSDQTHVLITWNSLYPPLTYTPGQTGTYYLEASTRAYDGLGSYTISASVVRPPSTAVYRFFDEATGSQFLSASGGEVVQLGAARPDLVDEGVAFRAAASEDLSGVPVFRFFDGANGAHFFTANAAERDGLLATRPDLAYEGVAFDEYAVREPNSTPIYRYFNTTSGTHLFTGSAAEVASIAASRPDLVAEGVAFFAPTS